MSEAQNFIHLTAGRVIDCPATRTTHLMNRADDTEEIIIYQIIIIYSNIRFLIFFKKTNEVFQKICQIWSMPVYVCMFLRFDFCLFVILKGPVFMATDSRNADSVRVRKRKRHVFSRGLCPSSCMELNKQNCRMNRALKA